MILLRQTSFKALEEPIAFAGDDGRRSGTHTARFGEIEQRGVALTAKGRALYDQLLASVRGEVQVGAAGAKAGDYDDRTCRAFQAHCRTAGTSAAGARGLAFFHYSATPGGIAATVDSTLPRRCRGVDR